MQVMGSIATLGEEARDSAASWMSQAWRPGRWVVECDSIKKQDY